MRTLKYNDVLTRFFGESSVFIDKQFYHLEFSDSNLYYILAINSDNNYAHLCVNPEPFLGGAQFEIGFDFDSISIVSVDNNPKLMFDKDRVRYSCSIELIRKRYEIVLNSIPVNENCLKFENLGGRPRERRKIKFFLRACFNFVRQNFQGPGRS